MVLAEALPSPARGPEGGGVATPMPGAVRKPLGGRSGVHRGSVKAAMEPRLMSLISRHTDKSSGREA